MKNFEHRDAVLTIVGLAAMSAIFLLVVFFPGRTRLRQLESEVRLAEAAQGEIPLEQAKLQQQVRRIERSREYVAASQARLVRSSNLHAALSEIASAAESADLAVTRLAPQARNEQLSWAEQEYHVKFRGEYPAVLQFLREIEQSPRLYRVRSLMLKREDRKESGELEGDVVISVCLVPADSTDPADSDASTAAAPADSSLRQSLRQGAAQSVAHRTEF